MRKVFKERLLKLADFLENIVPRKHFDLNYFTYDKDTKYTHEEDNDKILLFKLKKIKKDIKSHNCGAVACAIGWLPAVFPRTFMWDKNAAVILKIDREDDRANRDFAVAEEFLGLDEDKIQQLFTADYYPKDRRGPKSVAKKIKAFVKTDKLSDKEYEVCCDFIS